MKTDRDLCENVRLKFTSSNGVPVDRAVITISEYEAITRAHAAMIEPVSDLEVSKAMRTNLDPSCGGMRYGMRAALESFLAGRAK